MGRGSLPQIGRLQGREDEFRDPGFTGEPRAGHVQNLDAVGSDEGGEFLAGRFDTGMEMQERLPMFASDFSRLLRSAREQRLDAEYHRPVGVDDVPLSADEVICGIGLLQLVMGRDYTVLGRATLPADSLMNFETSSSPSTFFDPRGYFGANAGRAWSDGYPVATRTVLVPSSA